MFIRHKTELISHITLNNLHLCYNIFEDIIMMNQDRRQLNNTPLCTMIMKDATELHPDHDTSCTCIISHYIYHMPDILKLNDNIHEDKC